MHRLIAVLALTTLTAPVWAAPATLGGGTIHFVGRIVEDACVASPATDGSAQPQLSGCKAEVAARTRISVQPVVKPVVQQVTTTPTADHKAAIVTIEYM